MKQTPQGLLPIGTKLQFGDWDYGWITKAEIVGYTPNGRYYKIKYIDGELNNKTYNKSVKNIHQGYSVTYKGHCPITIK